MSIEINSQSVKSLAKNLKSVLAEYDFEMTHSQSLEVVSRIFGFKDWNTFSAKLKEAENSESTQNQQNKAKPKHTQRKVDPYESAISEMNFVRIPAGQIQMTDHYQAEISKDFYLCDHPVTNEEFGPYLQDIKRKTIGLHHDKCPVVDINWINAQDYISWLNQHTNKERYRLPTEAEWEYACRAGTSTRYSFGDDAMELKKHAWYFGNSNGQIQAIKQLLPNPWGLYDMHGNVYEWVQDYYGEYPKGTFVDPKGPVSGRDRVHRGGAWCDGNPSLRSYDPENIFGLGSSDRNGSSPLEGRNFIGFRLVKVIL